MLCLESNARPSDQYRPRINIFSRSHYVEQRVGRDNTQAALIHSPCFRRDPRRVTTRLSREIDTLPKTAHETRASVTALFVAPSVTIPFSAMPFRENRCARISHPCHSADALVCRKGNASRIFSRDHLGRRLDRWQDLVGRSPQIATNVPEMYSNRYFHLNRFRSRFNVRENVQLDRYWYSRAERRRKSSVAWKQITV